MKQVTHGAYGPVFRWLVVAAVVVLLLGSAACTPQSRTVSEPLPTATSLPQVDLAQWQAGAVINVMAFDTDDCTIGCLQEGLASIALSPDGQTVAVGKKDNTLTLWNVVDGSVARELPKHAGWVTSLAFSPDGALVASVSTNNDRRRELHLWHVADDTLQRRIALRTRNQVTDIAFHPTDRQVIVASEDHGGITFWRTDENGYITRRVIGGDVVNGLGLVQSLSFSNDGALLAAHTYRGIEVWHTDDRTQRWTLPGGGWKGEYVHAYRWIHHVALSPDGTLLAGGLAGSTTYIWRTADGALLDTFKGYGGHITSVDFSPDGQLLAVAYDDGVIDLWLVEHGIYLQSLREHSTAVVRAVFSADGQTLVSASEDGRIIRWHPAAPASVLPAVPPITPESASYQRAFCPPGMSF